MDKNCEIEELLTNAVKYKNSKSPLFEKVDKIDEVSDGLRKSKLSNQFGSICLKGDEFERAQTLFTQSIQEFEKFKFFSQNVDSLKRASFSNAWFNQANLFAGMKKYDQAIQAFIICI